MKNALFLILSIFLIIGCLKDADTDLLYSIKEVELVQERIPQIDMSNKDNPVFVSDTFNYKTVDFIDSTKLFFIDLNKDGNYTDPINDGVEIANSSAKSIKELHKQFTPLKDTFRFRIDQSYYLLSQAAIDQKVIRYRNINLSNLSKPVNSEVITKIPKIKFENIAGDSLLLDKVSLESDKYLLIEFWGTWCPGCIQKVPKMVTLHNRHKDQLDILSLNKGDSIKEIKQYIEDHNMNWRHGLADDKLINSFGDFRGFPSSYLFDNRGKLILKNASVEVISKVLGIEK